jgi:hypothetical protein
MSRIKIGERKDAFKVTGRRGTINERLRHPRIWLKKEVTAPYPLILLRGEKAQPGWAEGINGESGTLVCGGATGK